MVNLRTRNFAFIVIIIVGVVSIITMVDSKSHHSSLSSIYHKRNHHHNSPNHSVSLNDQRTIVRRKRFNSISIPKSISYSKSSNIHLINNSISTEKLKNLMAPEKTFKSYSPDVQTVEENDNSLEKLFGTTQNKYYSDNDTVLKSKKVINDEEIIHARIKRENSRVNKAPPFLSELCCKYIHDSKASFAKKVAAFEKSQTKINNGNKMDRTKRNIEYNDKNNNDTDDDGDEDSSEIEVRSRRVINDPNLKTQLDDIYPDTANDIEKQFPLMKLIRTKRFGDAGHEPEKDFVINKNGNKSSVKHEEDLKNTKNSSYNLKVSKLLEDLQNLAQTIVTKITEIRRSKKIMRRKRDCHGY